MSATTIQLLQQHHRRRRGTTLVWALAAALLAVLSQGAASLGWWQAGPVAGVAFAALSVLLLAVWWRRARRLTREAIARRLDHEWQLSARLESSQELSSRDTPLARAIQADAANRLGDHRAEPAPWWHGGLAVALLALLLGVVELGFVGWRLLASPPSVEQPAELPPDISASIEWRKPDSEIKAGAIEEIPLVAAATTATGFTTITLEVSVNGQPALSRPLDAATIGSLTAPGAADLGLPLYLDEVGAQPFDIVAYHLRAQRKTPAPTPVVTSPLQFIQVRPVRDDVEIIKPPPGAAGEKLFELSRLVGALKAAQLALLKQNFLLAHAPLERTDPVWLEENARVAAGQGTFTDKVVEARDFAINEGLPALVVENFGRIIPLSREAAALIAQPDNEAAVPPQSTCLALVTEIEKLIRKIVLLTDAKDGKPKPLPKNPDPFKDEQRFELPPRAATGAGELEQLQKEQQEQTEKNEQAPDGSAQQKEAAQKQAELADKLERLARAQKLAQDAAELARQAAADAQKAAEQLKQNDGAAARSPAAAAAQALDAAVKAQEKAGREAALAQLDAARRAMNEAARIEDNAARAAALDAVAEQLRREAVAQQETGSATAAKQLADAAREAQKAADAARRGADRKPAPGGSKPGGPKPGSESGDQTGSKPGSQDGSAPGDQPGENHGSRPAPQGPALAPDPKGTQLTPHPEGDRLAPAPDGPKPDSSGTPSPAPGPGREEGKDQTPGNGPGEGPGQGAGQGSGSTPGTSKQGLRPDPDGTQSSSLPDPTGQNTSGGSGTGDHSGQRIALTPLENAADAAASAEIALAGYRDSLEKALRRLQTVAPDEGAGEGPGTGNDSPTPATTSGNGSGNGTVEARALENVRLAAQTAAKLLNSHEADGLRRKIEEDLRPFDADGNVVMPPDLIAAIDRLRLLLAAALGTDRRDETVRRFNPDDIPPGYRGAVEKYFENLSRNPAH